jgi:hypothetical protein
MDIFDNTKYSKLICELLNDVQYISISKSGKMSGLRKHAEILVRKILNIGSDKQLMLGEIRRNTSNKAVNNSLNNLEDNICDKLIDTVKKINRISREGAHTKRIESFTDEEVGEVENAILDLYALLFIKYFQKIKIDVYTEPGILRIFSLLPPIIRYKTWEYLFEQDRFNIQVVDKLCLSIIKVHNKKTAYQWLEKNKEKINEIPYPNDDEIERYNKMHSIELSPGESISFITLNFNEYKNMYDLLHDKIRSSKTSINESGKMYKTFEETINYFHRELNGYSSFTDAEFIDLMEFVYIGRRSV